ncbi:hypothetical protein A4G20_10310 [Pasteurellaceae bacterium RH1A]|nr:hypothetical protein A4G20_10310 [Pasteurellaceae bacterium RH1A]
MTDTQNPAQPAKVRPPRKISPFWILPIVAFAIGCLMFFQILKERGQTITIRFQDGAGITAGKTAIRYQGLQIGQVKKVNFAEGLREVEVTAEINSEAKSVLRKDTKFWLVTPSASLAGVSGLDALVSGDYITLLPGEGESEDEFIAESEPPAVPVNDGDLLVKLVADDLGSISVGAGVYFRKVPVGSIAEYRFTPDHQKVEIDVVISKRYANLVKKSSHFWNISGISAKLDWRGLDLSVDSLMSVVQGAVAFDSPADAETADQGQSFQLFSDLKSARRGTEVKVYLPMTPNIQANETGVFYQGVQVGMLSKIEADQDKDGKVAGQLLIDPSYSDLLRKDSKILLKEPKFAFDKEQVSKLGELFRGHYFDIIPGKGEKATEFMVETENAYLLSQPNVLALTLTAPQSYSVAKGQGIYYNDVKIGEVLERRLTVDNVTFRAIIFPQYRNLIGANSKFVAISNLDVQLGLDGMRVQAGSPSDWLAGGVRVLPEKSQGQAKNDYPLYKDIESAEQGIVSDIKQPSLTLSASQLEGIGPGSVLLYRDFQVGEVLNVVPHKNKFDVELYVIPKYRHLVSDKSRFWVKPSVAVEASLQGVKLQTTPLMGMLKGAISFDNHGTKSDKTLYASLDKASSGNTYITLIAKDASKLSQGMPLKYMGLTVGQVEKLELQSAKKQIKVTAYLEGRYYNLIAKAGSTFKAISPEISTAGVKNLDAALQNYIDVSLGSGKAQTQFSLGDTDTSKTQFAGGFPVILETSDANGISPEAPVYYRGMQVGQVQGLSLSELGDRVLIHLAIQNKYKHLVRKNSQFWESSGYTMDVSLSGASISSGTMSQLLNGGIAFSTPSGSVVQPQAEANRRFLLRRKIPDEARGWDQGIAE